MAKTDVKTGIHEKVWPDYDIVGHVTSESWVRGDLQVVRNFPAINHATKVQAIFTTNVIHPNGGLEWVYIMSEADTLDEAVDLLPDRLRAHGHEKMADEIAAVLGH